MVNILRLTDLSAGSPPIKGWETYCATANGIVIYTGNHFAAYSVDDGETFLSIDPYAMCQFFGENFASDQIVIYAPQISRFVWELQTIEGNLILALATPQEVRLSGGQAWTAFRIPADEIELGWRFDRPSLAAGRNYLYLAVNIGDPALKRAGYSVGMRVSWGSLLPGSQKPNYEYFKANDPASFWMKTVSDTSDDTSKDWRRVRSKNWGEPGYFIAEKDRTSLHLYVWQEGDAQPSVTNIPMALIPIDDYIVQLPDGNNWLLGSKIDTQIVSATRSESQIWAAWSGARRAVERNQYIDFPYPHIGIAIIDIPSRSINRIEYLWDQKCAYAWPALATDREGNVGIAFCRCEENSYPQFCVGLLTGITGRSFKPITNRTKTVGAGGHYVGIASSFPDRRRFVAAGFDQAPTKGDNHPYYVVFD